MVRIACALHVPFGLNGVSVATRSFVLCHSFTPQATLTSTNPS